MCVPLTLMVCAPADKDEQALDRIVNADLGLIGV